MLIQTFLHIGGLAGILWIVFLECHRMSYRRQLVLRFFLDILWGFTRLF